MGHHIFVHRDKSIYMNDWDVLFVRHFLILAARELGIHDFQASIEKWDWHAPGVWLHIDEARLVGCAELFKRAAANIEEFGAEIPRSYAKANIQLPEGCQIEGNIRTDPILKGLKELANLVDERLGS
jgi:hypothetical protein